MLFFKGDKAAVDIISLCLWNVIQSILVDGPRSLHLTDFLLKLSKLDEELLLSNKNSFRLLTILQVVITILDNACPSEYDECYST